MEGFGARRRARRHKGRRASAGRRQLLGELRAISLGGGASCPSVPRQRGRCSACASCAPPPHSLLFRRHLAARSEKSPLCIWLRQRAPCARACLQVASILPPGSRQSAPRHTERGRPHAGGGASGLAGRCELACRICVLRLSARAFARVDCTASCSVSLSLALSFPWPGANRCAAFCRDDPHSAPRSKRARWRHTCAHVWRPPRRGGLAVAWAERRARGDAAGGARDHCLHLCALATPCLLLCGGAHSEACAALRWAVRGAEGAQGVSFCIVLYFLCVVLRLHCIALHCAGLCWIAWHCVALRCVAQLGGRSRGRERCFCERHPCQRGGLRAACGTARGHAEVWTWCYVLGWDT